MTPGAIRPTSPPPPDGPALRPLGPVPRAVLARAGHYATRYAAAAGGARRFALIGSGAAGKSAIARQAAALAAITVIDVDELFERQFGTIKAYGAAHGWQRFFEAEGELSRSVLLAGAPSADPVLVVMPASALCHGSFIDASAHTLAVTRATASVICILASRNPAAGACLSVLRQLRRGYFFSFPRKARQYLYQSAFYAAIADRVVINRSTIGAAAAEVAGFVSGPGR